MRPDNARAIALYESRGYRHFGRYLDFYEDHADALRFEKRLGTEDLPQTDLHVPYYAQTTNFTCGAATLLMALKALDPATDQALRDLAAQYPDLVVYDPDRGMIRFTSDLTFGSGSAEVTAGV